MPKIRKQQRRQHALFDTSKKEERDKFIREARTTRRESLTWKVDRETLDKLYKLAETLKNDPRNFIHPDDPNYNKKWNSQRKLREYINKKTEEASREVDRVTSKPRTFKKKK